MFLFVGIIICVCVLACFGNERHEQQHKVRSDRERSNDVDT